MRYKELLSVRGTFLLLLVGLVLVIHSILSDRILWLTRKRDLLLSFCLGDSRCANVLSKMALLDKIFYGETGIEKSGVVYCHRRSNSPSLRDKQSRVILVPDALPKVDP